jgi:hypothetical protein
VALSLSSLAQVMHLSALFCRESGEKGRHDRPPDAAEEGLFGRCPAIKISHDCHIRERLS